MTAIDYIVAVLVILVVSLIFVRVLDAWSAESVAACIRRISFAECPLCKHAIGADAASIAVLTIVKARSENRKRSRGQYSSSLLKVTCPHCSAKLHFLMDGSMLCCNH